MSSLLEPVDSNNKITIKPINTTENSNNCYFKHVLKSKNIFKPKCNKALKRKLKKYKLKRDGKEDQDILDVSQILLSTLKIKSPTNRLKSPISESEENRPKNYLFKMARGKQKSKPKGTDGITKESNKALNLLINGSQTKLQTNAFQIMMDSRSKSIGSNSPGKEKNIDESEIEKLIEKKKVKVKRNLALQKMAEAKGSLKKKELEDYQEAYVKQKMEERAERLKNMIITKEKKGKRKVSKHVKINIKTNKVTVTETQEIPKNDDLDAINDNKNITTKTKTLQLVDICSDNDNIKQFKDVQSKNKHIKKDDAEFLKKLSPSIRKKENMLCYFKKLDNISESCVDVEQDTPNNNSADVIITSKIKKKAKTKKLSLKKDFSNGITKDGSEIDCNATNGKMMSKSPKVVSDVDRCANRNSDRKKRKRHENSVEVECDTDEMTSSKGLEEAQEGRPKRQVKKLVKYLDEVQLCSSDEEQHIFTPKKRKQIYKKTKYTAKVTIDSVTDISDKDSKNSCFNETKISSEIKMQKKPLKLAPIFATKPHLTPEEIEAKQKFLQSGIPEQLKKVVINQQKNDISESYNNFSSVVHVQQKVPTVADMSTQSFFNLLDCDSEDEAFVQEDHSVSKLLTLTKTKPTSDIISKTSNNTHSILQNIKKTYPKFPVYRTYRLLKSKSKGEFKDYSCADFDNSVEFVNDIVDGVNENPNSLAWTDKYKATSTKHLIGNFESINELRKWLVSWTENQNQMKPKNTTTTGSDSSDFYESDTDSRDSLRTTNSLLIISGPVGSGKTSSVYTVAAELAIKVIEVNASSKRTGKVMLQDLQEATQSHKVNRVNGSSENSQKSQEISDPFVLKTIKKRGRPKQETSTKNMSSAVKNDLLSLSSASQEGVRTGMSLILIDDADIVFDQDDGFSSAIAQLVRYSKRPVVLVTSTLTCPHLQRFLQCGRIISMRPLLPRLLGTWLDVMCLADNVSCWPGLGAKFLDFYKGDIRKTINCLQFYMTTHGKAPTSNTVSQNVDSYNLNTEDENSSLSWTDHECFNENSLMPRKVSVEDSVWNHFMGNQTNLMLLRYPTELFSIWWNIPNLLGGTFDKTPEHASKSEKSNKKEKIKELEVFAEVLDILSFADYMGHMKPVITSNSTSGPWCSFESDSLSELENLDQFHMSHEISSEIAHSLVTCSVVNAQRILQIQCKTDIDFPRMAVQRDRDKIISRHDSITSCLNPAAVLDRRALALDYWSSCRTICRTEKTKADTVSKRNNRFCHYLKSLNVLCKNDSYDKLGDSLCCRGKN